VRIPVAVAPGESIEGSCFALAPPAVAPELPRLGGARLALERSAQGVALRVRTTLPVAEPAVEFAIRVACPGRGAESRRDFSLLLDPRTRPVETPARAAQPVATPRTPAASGFAAAVATLIARIGDTLESIARAIFPDNRGARSAYITALREQNPPLAALRDDEQIPVESPIALPDLRTFAHRHATPDTRLAEARPPRQAPARTAASRASTAPATAAEPAPGARAVAPPPAATAPAKTRATAAPRAQPEFVLRLSGGEVDLSRSRGVDERTRAQLRERLQLLDSDDQVAALLALRHSVKQLESRVAELQLKLAGMPASLAAQAAKADAAKAEAAKAEAAKAEAAKAEAAKAETAKAEAAKAEAARVEATKVEAAKAEAAKAEAAKAEAAKAEAAKAEVAKAEAAKAEAAKTQAARAEAARTEAAKTEAARMETARAEVAKARAAAEPPKPTAKTAAAPRALPPEPAHDWLSGALWFGGAFAIVLALLLVWRRARSARVDEEPYPDEPVAAAASDLVDPEDLPRIEPAAAVERREPVLSAAPHATATAKPAPAAAAPAAPARASEADALRRRYLDERFPEVARGAIRLEDTKSVVKAARLFYEDGAAARAIELLHFAIETRPEEIRLWLALFEIFRLERLKGEYAELARRFKERHSGTDAWLKVQYFGREVDPGNMLYQDEAFKSLETIGPSAARRAQQSKFDPLAENWLDAPDDFENEALANDLRKALMTSASIQEHDLAPNPMPALRDAAASPAS